MKPAANEEEDVALATLRQHIDAWLLEMQVMGEQPGVAASKMFDVLVEVSKPVMGYGAIRMALLMVYEKTYEHPMTFLQRNNAKELLDQISHARRKVEGRPHLILPGDDAS